MFSSTLRTQAKQLLKACGKRNVMVATAESCTGGLIAALLTEIPGSSAVFERGFVTYSDAAKQSMLGVKAGLLSRHGAVSTPVAKAMAEGALKASKAKLSISVTGIAGPGGGSKAKPVGLVYIAVSLGKNTVVAEYRFKGGRSSVRLQAVAAALKLATVELSRYA